MIKTPSNYTRLFIAYSGVFGIYAILFAADSSHALSGDASNWATIAVRYQMWHGIPLFGLGIWSYLTPLNTPLPKVAYAAGVLWILGVILFSGSLSIMAFTDWHEIGILTPIGGLTMAGEWCCIVITALRLKKNMT